MRIKTIHLCLVGLILHGLVGYALADSTRTPDDFSSIRGFNYVPSYARTDVEIWGQFDSKIVDRELAFAERLKLSTVRIFLQELVYRNDPEGFLDNLESFLALSAKHNIKVMPVLFDSCFGVSPSMESEDFWVANPGPDHMGRDYWPLGEAYVDAILHRFRNDDRILMWDIMNEPEVTWRYRTPMGREAIWQFCRHFISFVKERDGKHPVTVGVATYQSNVNIVDMLDVVSLHNYGPEENLRSDIRNAKLQAGSKPVIISEVGAPGRDQPYEMSVRVCEDTNIGWFIWELMIGRNQFQAVQGVIYPDGTIRKKSEVEAILGGSAEHWVVRPDSEGIPIARDLGPSNLMYRAHLRFRQTPTDERNFSERYTYFRTLTWNATAKTPGASPLGPKGLEAKQAALQSKQLFDDGEVEVACTQMDALISITAADIDQRKGKPYKVEPPGLD